jgi:hypothetical protein
VPYRQLHAHPNVPLSFQILSADTHTHTKPYADIMGIFAVREYLAVPDEEADLFEYGPELPGWVGGVLVHRHELLNVLQNHRRLHN